MTQNTTKKPACKEVGQPMQDRSRLRTDSRQCALGSRKRSPSMPGAVQMPDRHKPCAAMAKAAASQPVGRLAATDFLRIGMLYLAL